MKINRNAMRRSFGLSGRTRFGAVFLLLGLCGATGIVSPALATGDTTGTVAEFALYNDGHNSVLIRLSVPPAGTRPACATSTVYAGALDVSTATGQAQYAMLLTAQATGASVRIVGAGTCTITSGGTVEDVNATRFPE